MSDTTEELVLKYEARIRELEEENAELRRTQVEISTAKELYLKIFEDFPALIWRSRLDKKCDYFNRTWVRTVYRSLQLDPLVALLSFRFWLLFASAKRYYQVPRRGSLY